MTEGTSLDDLLNASPEPETVTEPVETRERDEHGRFAAKETGVEPAEPEGEAEPVPPTDKLPQEEYKAIKEEREKRQTLERELETLKTQIQQFQAQQNPPEPPPSLWEDEEGWGGNLVKTAVTQSTHQSRLMTSEMLMRQAEPEFDSLMSVYVELERANPAIIPQVMNNPHPYAEAIKIAKNQRAMQELGAVNVSELEAKMREKIMAELETGSTPLSGKPAIPASLTGERSVASRTGPAWSGPTSLDDLLR